MAPQGALSEPLTEKKDVELGKVGAGVRRGDSVTSVVPTTKVPEGASLAYTLRCVWKLVGLFWGSDDLWTKCKAWMMLIIVCMSVGFAIVILIGIGDGQGALGTALQERNSEVYYGTIISMLLLLVADTCFPIIKDGGGGVIAKEWRKSVSRILFSDYISPGNAYFQLKSQENTVDNPDQRIGQDLQDLCERSIALLTAFVWCIATIVTFSYQMYQIEAVGPTLLATTAGTMVTMTILFLAVLGPPIMRIARIIMAEEANLRFALIRVRENAEPVAFYRGESYELARVTDLLRSVLLLRYRGIFLEGCQAVTAAVANTFPNVILHFIVGPAIIDGILPFGSLARTLFLFDMMLMALRLVLENIATISVNAAQAVRVVQLLEILDNVNMGRDVHGTEPEDRKMIILDEDFVDDEVVISVINVTFQPPGFAVPTVEGLTLKMNKGESCLLAGPSGIGKSSILRCIAGLWTDGRGSIHRCPIDDCFMLPQEAYLCLGTLRSNIIYPEFETPDDDSGRFTDLAIEIALEEANLGKLLNIGFHLDEEVNLKGILSGGERQRLSFARLILRDSMKLTILDEATSALDIVNEEKMYRKMMAKSEVFLSVGHRPTLDRFHTHRLLLEKQSEGKGATAKLEKLDPDNLPSAQLAAAMKARGEA